MSLSYSKAVILYAEDDHDDFEIFKDALIQETDKYSLAQANNGTEVISFLEHHVDALPAIIILDLNMPVMDGKQTLRWLKQNEQFKHIPVMVFTTSSREDDIKLCKTYDCTFFRKPTLYRDLLHIIQMILQICEQQKAV